MPPHEPPPITEAQYWRDYELIDNDIHAAIVCCYTHRAISHLVATDPEIYARVNANPEFWQATAYSLQNMLFILLSRILGHSSGVHTVHQLLNATIARQDLFTKDARRARVLAVPGGKWTPEALAEYDRNNTWEPTGANLRTLKTDLRPHTKKLEEIYSPIRDQVAHIILKDDTAIADLYTKTQKSDLDEILQFLHGLVKAIRDRKSGGQPHDIKADNYGFRAKANRIMKETEDMLRSLQ